MIGTVNAVVTDVQPRVIKEGKPDQRTIYDVVDQAGEKFTAWEKPLAEAAYHTKGQPSIWKVKVETNGSYTNRTLLEITPVTGGNAMMTQATETFPQSAPQIIPEAMDTPVIGLSEKDKMIHRQAATKVAAMLKPANEPEFWSTVLALIGFYESGVLPVKQDAVTAALFEEPTDDDIPF